MNNRKKGKKSAVKKTKPQNTTKKTKIPKNVTPQITHLIRIEAINIDAICDDTDDISIRRGGSLLIRQAVIDAEDWLTDYLSKEQVERVSVGASIGTYGLKINNDQDPNTVVKHITNQLNQHEHYRLACFAIALCAYNNDYETARENLLAQIRCQQLRQPSGYIPQSIGHDGVCEFDHLSPAGRKEKIKKKEKHISDSAWLRFNYGRKQRKQFYQDELKKINLSAIDFTDDLGELSDNHDFGNLSDKIALIYFDGNSFSSVQRKHCKTIAAQRNFDESIQATRRTFLADLLTRAASDQDFKTDQGKLRLEVLMWGGDEFLLVVPAWKGWEVTQRFLTDHAPNFSFTPDRGANPLLTHAGGLVFCGSHTPIVRIRDLTRELADTIKEHKHNKDKNSFLYLVLESIEYPTSAIEGYFGQRYSAVANDHSPLLASTIDPDALKQLLDTVSSRVLHTLGSVLVRHGNKSEAYTEQLKRTEKILGAQQMENVQGWLNQLFPNQQKTPHWQWLHLLELHDYLAPEHKSNTTNKESVS